jgi:hypothetical protein
MVTHGYPSLRKMVMYKHRSRNVQSVSGSDMKRKIILDEVTNQLERRQRSIVMSGAFRRNKKSSVTIIPDWSRGLQLEKLVRLPRWPNIKRCVPRTTLAAETCNSLPAMGVRCRTRIGSDPEKSENLGGGYASGNELFSVFIVVTDC